MNEPMWETSSELSDEPGASTPLVPGIESTLVEGIARRRRRRRRLASACCVFALAGAGGLFGLRSIGGGPDRALAIERQADWVTLTIADASATDEQMNSELAAAGIDRVRVVSVPGPPQDGGTWAGTIDIGPRKCIGGPWFFGTGIEIPTTSGHEGEGHATDLVDDRLPHNTGTLLVSDVQTPHGGDTARVRVGTVTDPDYSAEILIAIRPGSESGSRQIGSEELAALGGQFATYAQALDDGVTSCPEFGMQPWPTFSSDADEQRWVVAHWPKDAPVPAPATPAAPAPLGPK